MTPTVIFDNVSKKFQRGERHDSLRDLVPSLFRGLWGRRAPDQLGDQEFWALRNVSFEVRPGEALGIIGSNGAGKSTALKVLTRILRPTIGRCQVIGRVGALIEVAAGFHPDLTGRENTYLQGAIMGMRREEITRKLDAVIDFAGVAEFIDTPVKRYSSGMNARLGFSIAAHLNPQVLLIDEVLAVGDRSFQQRCYDRMREFRDSGVAIVFVSHNLSAISSLCSKTLVLRGGEVQMLGATTDAIAAYVRLIESVQESGGPLAAGEAAVEVLSPSRQPVSHVRAGEPFTLRAVVKIRAFSGVLDCAVRIRRMDTGDLVFETSGASLGCAPLPGTTLSVVEILWHFKANLSRGQYSVELLFFDPYANVIFVRLQHAAQFTVDESETESGVAYLEPRTSGLVALAATDCRDVPLGA